MRKCLIYLLIISLFFLQSNSKNHGSGTPVSYNRPIKIRLLVLKHCKEKMADDDANLAISGAQKAAAKGLDIQVIGNHYIDKDGKAYQCCFWDDSFDLPKLKTFVSSQMKEKAAGGDTLVVFTIGHGGEQGSLQSLGQRSDVMEALVGAAEENNQRVLWWQLSCYASARLPQINSLTPNQQRLFSILASSNSTTQSPAGVEGTIMEKVFVAMAEKSQELDVNNDGTITADELRNFLNNKKTGRGNLLYTRRGEDPLFGYFRINLPIIDQSKSGKVFEPEYVPYPDD